MTSVTHLLEAAECGDRQAAADLLPLVYDELRKLAACRLVEEKAGQTLSATALVHEAYLRLVGNQQFEGKNHFFAAAAEAMRRIMVDSARRKMAVKHGHRLKRIPIDDALKAPEKHPAELLALNEALAELEQHEPDAAKLICLRYFAGFSHQAAAKHMAISRRVADRLWLLGRTWLFQQLNNS